MVILPGIWHDGVSARTGWPGVGDSILKLDEIASLICNFYLSVAAHTLFCLSRSVPEIQFTCYWDIKQTGTTTCGLFDLWGKLTRPPTWICSLCEIIPSLDVHYIQSQCKILAMGARLWYSLHSVCAICIERSWLCLCSETRNFPCLLASPSFFKCIHSCSS